jgi:hypothetical protein
VAARDEAPARGVAEVDGNRTRQVERLGLAGFEDRGDHQDAYTSTSQACLTPQIHCVLAEPAPSAPDSQPAARPSYRPSKSLLAGSSAAGYGSLLGY